MIKLTQQDYWNSRASVWSKYDVPLIPSQDEISFHRKHMVPGGNTLILGATPQLCSMAREVSKTVTAIDFAKDIIAALRLDKGVEYICMDWFEFFAQRNDTFDNIVTDGAPLCLDFPKQWQKIANDIQAHLAPGGIFSARIYTNISRPPQDSYKNPNLERFVSSMGNVDANWMVHPKHGDYAKYDMLYAFPPEQEILNIFDKLTLHDKLVPEYEEGARFVSYFWQKS